MHSYDRFLDRELDRYEDDLDAQRELEEREQREKEERLAALPQLDDYDIYCIVKDSGLEIGPMEYPMFKQLLKSIRLVIKYDRQITGILPDDD